MIKRRGVIKKIFLGLLLCAAVIFIPLSHSSVIAEDDNGKSYDEQLSELIDSFDFQSLDEVYLKYLSEINGGSSFKEELVAFLNGTSPDGSDYFGYLKKITGDSFKNILPPIIAVFAIAVLSGLLSSFSVKSDGVKESVFLTCYAAGTSVVFAETAIIAVRVLGFISEICGFMQSIYPVFATITSLSGESAKSAALTPVCSAVIQVVTVSVSGILIPSVVAVCALSAAGSVSEKYSVAKTRDFIVDGFKWFVGIAVSVLSLFTAISGISGSVRDGVSLRALKYAVGNTVPVIGGFAREGVEVFLVAAQSIKNGTGALFMLILAVAFAKPAIELTCYSLLLKLIGALSAPFSDKRFGDMLTGFQKTMSLLNVILVCVAIMFFLMIFIVLFLQIGF